MHICSHLCYVLRIHVATLGDQGQDSAGVFVLDKTTETATESSDKVMGNTKKEGMKHTAVTHCRNKLHDAVAPL